MIYDKIKNIDLYKGLYPNLDIAIDYIKKGEYINLPLGKQDIVGKDVWVSVIEIEGKDAATTPFEIHKKYLDIHVDITGNELIETGGNGPEVSYDENRDFGVVECENANSSYMSPDDFYICMLNEPHKPACAAPGKDKAIKKCIFKVLV